MMRPRSEKSIQESVVKYAKSKGLVAIKLSTAGRFGTSGWPDYQFLGRKHPMRTHEDEEGSIVFFIEFKAPGKKPTPLQEQKASELQTLGFNVYVIDDVHGGKTVIDKELA